MRINITKIDGRQEPFDADRINQAIAIAGHDLVDIESKITQIATETELTLYDGITTKELDQAVINACVQNIKDDPDFDKMATRLLLKTIYKAVLGDYDNLTELTTKHQQGFANYIKQGIADNILDARLQLNFDLNELSQALILQNDDLLTYTGLSTMQKRYLVKNSQQQLMETPQYFFMRVAMGLALHEAKATAIAIKFYKKMSTLEYLAGGSTNINAGTVRPRLSNCYLMDMEDSIDHIGKTISDIMQLSKATGGIGLSVTKLRANGSPIATNNTASSGPIPFLHIIDAAIRAISRAGKKMGALCFYMENWHYDFDEFLDLKQNAGDEYRRTRTANTAVYMSDEFMKRVQNDGWWYLFDPRETPDLVELYGQKFSQRYQEYIALAEAGKIQRYKRVKATDQFRKIIVALQATSHPWLTWKDPINVRNLNQQAGTIYCSNLCTEITLAQNKDNISVCNLLSINLARHLTTGQQIDWDKLADSSRLGIRQLDNLVDINQPPVPEAKNFDQANRAVGMGIMGLTDMLEKMGLPYDSTQAYDLVDQIMEFIAYHAIDASADLAQERGLYPNFANSGWSQGFVPLDTIKHLAQERQLDIAVNQNSKLDWQKLKPKVKQGMRNATVLAIAPTANIGLVAGTSPGLDPRFAQVFSRNTLSGKYLEINFNLVDALKKLNIWDQVKDQLITDYGNLDNITIIPDHLKRLYKDSFSVPAQAFIEVAARAQKWVDQAISRNMYLATRDTAEIMQIYIQAWQAGLKTTYYLHMKPRHNAEQSTAKVNKSEAMGRKGFSAITLTVEATPITCPIDPQERLQCDSCQ
ncbi:MAG: Ribonucleoside-diphosphate reductase [Candidatus Magasanikbacteria bacterium GW2011_GWC2_40_17]|nr:MAG: Ribonucleoside-diphosphate reductase [Candidatus Magasanikbacteria bacterium GW2011_GWC2_40_17]